MQRVDATLLIQKYAKKIAWFKNKLVNKLMQDKWILCLHRSVCAHNTFNSNLQPPNSGMSQGASINITVSIVFIIRMLFEIID